MSHFCTLELPWPPTVNHLYGVGHYTRQRYIKQKSQVFYDYCRYNPSPIKFGEQLIEIFIDLHPPKNFRYDFDNRLKSLLDGLQLMRCFHDDAQIMAAHIYKKKKFKGGKVVVQISLFDDQLEESEGGADVI